MPKFFRRLSVLVQRRRLVCELAEEMAAHREMMPPERQRNFGNLLSLQEQAADQWGWTWLDHLRQNLAYAVRQLRRSPGFTLTAIAVLSLGIGVNLAEAHIFNAFLRLNVRDVGSLCQLYRVTRQETTAYFSIPEIEFYQRHNRVLSAVVSGTALDIVYFAQDAVALRGALVSGNFFGELGTTPLYGRLLDEQDDHPGAAPVAVLGYDYWQSRFGGDPQMVMRTIRLNDKPVQIVGIAPAQFGGLARHADAWMAASQSEYLAAGGSVQAAPLADYQTRQTQMFGRLEPGVSRETAQAQFVALASELSRQQPRYVHPGDWLKVQPVERPVNSSPAVILLLSTFILLVLLVLFSACANLGNMLLARGLVRRREMEIRLALGAGRWRLVRQLMTENLLLAALASVAALFVGKMAALLALRITTAPSNLLIVTDWRIILASAALGLGATLAFGFAPALQMVKGGPRATRTRQVLVSVQLAASCVLLIVSSFFTRALQHSFQTTVASGYSEMALVDPAFYLHNHTPSEARREAGEIAARLRHLPGVEAASVAIFPPIQRDHLARAASRQFCLNEVDPRYFRAMHLALLAGRIFGPADSDAVVVSESAARKLWPNQSPLGQTLFFEPQSRTVVGVVEDSGLNVIRYPESVEAYLPISDRYAPYATVVVREVGNPAQMSATLRSVAIISGIAPLVYTYAGLLDQQVQHTRNMLHILGSLAAVASLLALSGIFGLLAFTVAQRTREIGVRMTLGARGRDVLRIVLGQYALPFGIGAACGVVLATAATRVLRNVVYGFIPFDVLSFAAGLLLFAAVALAASIVPARRALRIDPASALRYE